MVLGVRTPPDQAGAIRHSKPLVLVPDHLQNIADELVVGVLYPLSSLCGCRLHDESLTGSCRPKLL